MAAESGRAGAHRTTVELTAFSAHNRPRLSRDRLDGPVSVDRRVRGFEVTASRH